MQFGFGRDCNIRDLVSTLVLQHVDEYVEPWDAIEYLPGLGDTSEDSSTACLFHRDDDGYIAFTAEEAEATSDYTLICS